MKSPMLYRAMWRWHFYAGFFVIPFFAMLALTGLGIMWFTIISPEYGERLVIEPQAKVLTISEQEKAVRKSWPQASIGQYIAPYAPENPALFRLDEGSGARMIALNPYSGEILRDVPKDGTWKEFLTRIHGTLLIGSDGGPGDLFIEAAAGLGIVMLATGLYLWWPRMQWFPKGKGRMLAKSLHASGGLWLSIVLLFFLLSGLAWTSVWGGKMVQAWSTFPAEKWDNVPLSDLTHANLNHDAEKVVPWALEQTLMPQSKGLPQGTPVVLETVVALGRAIGFEGRFQVAAPADEKGVWTLSQDSMSYDSTDPTADRTIHVDQYTGQILASVSYSDYSLPGKAMAVGIALHEGQLGWGNFMLNVAFCIGILTLCGTALLMWWMRKPTAGFGEPRYASDFRLPVIVGIVALMICVAFPVTAIPLLAFALIDFLLPKSWKEAGAT